MAANTIIYVAGQNEVWHNNIHNLFFGECPPQNEYKPKEISVNFLTVEENENYLQKSYDLIKKNNPKYRLIVCVAPIPSMATFLDKNVITQSVFYKSILRVAVENFINKNPEVAYFPTYDLSLVNEFYPHDEDHRHPNKSFMEKTMNMFDLMFSKC